MTDLLAVKRTLGGQSPTLAHPQQALDLLVRGTRTQAAGLAQQAASGKLAPKEFGSRMAALLEDRHALAVVIGRNHAGDRAPLEEDDRRFAEMVVNGESEFLQGFVEDLQAGRYEGKAEAAQTRAQAYAGRLTGSANEAAALTSDPETEIHWHLHAGESCPDCVRIAAGSPYTPETIPTWPGMNQTQCVFNCRCSTEMAGKPAFRVTA